MYGSCIKAVGGHLDDLPTYDQVMIEVHPPSYYPSQRCPSGGVLPFRGPDGILELPPGQEILEIASVQVLAALRRENGFNAEEDERRVRRLSPHIVEFLIGVKRALNQVDPPSDSAPWKHPTSYPKEPSKTVIP